MATPAERSTTADSSSMNMSFQEGSGAGTEAGTGDGGIGSKFPASGPVIPVGVDPIMIVVSGTVICIKVSKVGVVVVLSSTQSSSKT